MALRIVVADDHDIIRRGLKQLLTAHSGWEVCAEAKTGREAVAVAEQLKPDIVVMDISMPDLNGLEAARRIKKALPRTEILILTLHFSDQLVREIVEAGGGESQAAEAAADDVDDDLYQDAIRVVCDAGRASTSTLQRRLRIGYGRAARLIDLMEKDGIVGPPEGTKPREVLKNRNWMREFDDHAQE